MTNFISSREKLHCSAQELHTIHKIASNYNKQQHNERHAILLLHQPCICGLVKCRECGELLYGRKFPLKMKVAVYKSYVRPKILNGSEVWCLKGSEMEI